jgi:hypothetical protein
MNRYDYCLSHFNIVKPGTRMGETAYVTDGGYSFPVGLVLAVVVSSSLLFN